MSETLSLPPALPAYEVRWHYDVYLWEISEEGHGWIATDCDIAFSGSRDMTRLGKDFEAWVKILRGYNDAHDIGEEYSDLSEFDWDSFNASGLVLAKRLSALLGPQRSIQYSKCILDEDSDALVWMFGNAPKSE